MRNIKLILQYNGSAYHGWQIQDNAVTVQETLQNAIFSLTGERVSVNGCGRTDAGVHALGYVCNFGTRSKIPGEKFSHALNVHLPDDIVCILSEEVSDSFDSKRSRAKTYSYVIHNSEFPDVFKNGMEWHFKQPLDIDAMKKAAEAFVGEYDFIGFASSGFTVKTTVRTIYSLTVEKYDNTVRIDVCGNGFLYNMVRIIAGTLVFCGIGKINPDDIKEIILSRDRTRAGITAPPDGLYLSEVFYQ